MDAHHLLVVGDSGSGKTTLLRQIHEQIPAPSVWQNPGRDESRVAGQEVGTLESMLGACSSVDRWEDLRLNNTSTRDRLTVLSECRDFAHTLWSRAGRPTQIVVDEAHEVLPESVDNSNPVRQMLHKDRDRGVRVVLSTQDPQDLARAPLKQVRRLVWVGRPSTWHRGFMRYYNLDPDEHLPSERFEWVDLDPSEPPRVVARGSTDSDFAA